MTIKEIPGAVARLEDGDLVLYTLDIPAIYCGCHQRSYSDWVHHFFVDGRMVDFATPAKHYYVIRDNILSRMRDAVPTVSE